MELIDPRSSRAAVEHGFTTIAALSLKPGQPPHLIEVVWYLWREASETWRNLKVPIQRLGMPQSSWAAVEDSYAASWAAAVGRAGLGETSETRVRPIRPTAKAIDRAWAVQPWIFLVTDPKPEHVDRNRRIFMAFAFGVSGRKIARQVGINDKAARRIKRDALDSISTGLMGLLLIDEWGEPAQARRIDATGSN